MQKITPFLWFNENAEEAMNFYISIFKDSKILEMHRLDNGKVMTGSFQIEGQKFHVINGGPMYSFTPAISLFVSCEDQAEVDDLWKKLSENGQELQCGWVTDKFGITWQIIPDELGDMLSDKDSEKSGRAMQAMMQMKKIDIGVMRRAFDGE